MKRIIDRCESLCVNPYPSEVVRVQGYIDEKVSHEKNVLSILIIDKRSKVYD